MSADDERWLEIAGLILDGKAVDWQTIPGGRPTEDASADALRVIADVADMHRAPTGEPGRRWGTLAIHEQIGHGTFGDVYRARDTALDRDVALKLVDYTPSATAPDEGRLLARVRHSNVVTVHGAAIHDGRYGIWMEFIRGRTLAAVVREQGPLTVDEVIAIGIDVCRALTAIHESGLLHGDIKPQNVMREEGGRIVVMDFGTGRAVKDAAAADKLAGTPLYLAPEVLFGAPPDVRADVYSAGVLLYYLLTGAHPAKGSTLDDVRAAHASGARTPVRSRRPEIPRPLAAIIERAIADQPSDRFESAADFERALRDPLAKRARAWNKRLVALMGVSVVIAALAGGRGLLSMTAGADTRGSDLNRGASDLYNQSYKFGLKNDWTSALTLVNEAIAADETSGVAHTWKAWCLRNTHAPPSRVIEEARRAVELSSPSAWGRLWIEATYAGFMNDRDREVAALTELVKLRPDHVWAVSTFADTLHALGRTQEALPYYIQEAEFRAFDGAFIIRAAKALIETGDASGAVRYARRAQGIIASQGWFWGASDAWTLPGEALWRRGDVNGAAVSLDAVQAECARMVETERNDLAASLVTANLSLGRSRAAAEAADLITDQGDRHLNRASAAFHSGNRRLARREMSMIGDGLHADEFFYLVEAGRLGAAQTQLDATQGLVGGMQNPLPGLNGMMNIERGRIALARGELNRALAYLEHAASANPTQSIYRFESLADVYVRQRDFVGAIATLQESLHYRSRPFLAVWWMRNELRLAELYHATGRDADALPLEAHLEKLLVAADPDFPLLVRLKALDRQTRLR